MDIERFASSPVGRLTPIHGWDSSLNQAYDHFAFVPNDLPTEIPLSQSTVQVMGEADRALGALNARIRLLPNPQLLVRPALKKEAQDTSALEGTYAHLEDILKAGYIDPPKRSSEVREVLNYVDAATTAFELIKTLPISRRLLEPIQKTLVAGTRGDGFDAGRLRERQVFIGDEGSPVEEARFIPPPPAELDLGFSAWERWLNSEDTLPLLAKVAMSHYQFETLHPFSDGNGRLGRLIITLQLMDAEELEYPILNLSSWFEPRRTQYIDALRAVSISGDFDVWIRMFATAVRDSSRVSLGTIDSLLEYRDSVVQLAEASGIRGITADVADVIIGSPVITIKEFAEAKNVAYGTAKAYVGKLEQLGVLSEITGGDYGRVFYAREVTRRINRDATRVSEVRA